MHTWFLGNDQAVKKLDEKLILATKDINFLYSQKFKDLRQFERDLTNKEAELLRREQEISRE